MFEVVVNDGNGNAARLVVRFVQIGRRRKRLMDGKIIRIPARKDWNRRTEAYLAMGPAEDETPIATASVSPRKSEDGKTCDPFSYSVGRKLALKQAPKNTNLSYEARALIWQVYFQTYPINASDPLDRIDRVSSEWEGAAQPLKADVAFTVSKLISAIRQAAA